jgi:hypothetical protein
MHLPGDRATKEAGAQLFAQIYSNPKFPGFLGVQLCYQASVLSPKPDMDFDNYTGFLTGLNNSKKQRIR